MEISYHQNLSSQAISIITYVLLQKTMAAGRRAKKEQLDRQKIDRSGVVSKYVGETEKRLNKVFLKAVPNKLMLFIDGANVLTGKR